ncbi:MAG: dephospho-CoA kinase [Candidatus Tectomicrobia bacterium]|uniref:Dephospho-CoA kinase n=1 Tax=Tectimicrobiota bacterium TaxID=2528274 RepID=A0A933GK29_UNCTE|nr:dephospho-CoA kinase [Candidatus Tectomicrobia bacterium]
MMKVIGLTGGIGSGKSLVTDILIELGAELINADLLGHRIYLPGREAWQEIINAFGREVVGPDETIDRKKLGQIVFSDKKALEKLNSITHPRIFEEAAKEIKTLRAKKGNQGIVVFEAAILIEAKWTSLVDYIWVVAADREVVIERLMERNKMTREQSEARIDSQLSNEERIKFADVVIMNNDTLNLLNQQVITSWQKLINQ